MEFAGRVEALWNIRIMLQSEIDAQNYPSHHNIHGGVWTCRIADSEQDGRRRRWNVAAVFHSVQESPSTIETYKLCITVPSKIVADAPVRFASSGTLPLSSCCALVELIYKKGAILPNHFAGGSRLGVGNFPKYKANSEITIPQHMRRSSQRLRSLCMTG